MKKRGVRLMDYIFILILLVGALGIQFGNGWLSKNEFTLKNFAMLIPLLLVAQYFIAWGYHDGTQQSSFITAHIFWTAVLILGTLISQLYPLPDDTRAGEPLRIAPLRSRGCDSGPRQVMPCTKSSESWRSCPME